MVNARRNDKGPRHVDWRSNGTDFNVVVERDEDGIYFASVPGLPGCHTHAPTLDLVLKRIKGAIALHLED